MVPCHTFEPEIAHNHQLDSPLSIYAARRTRLCIAMVHMLYPNAYRSVPYMYTFEVYILDLRLLLFEIVGDLAVIRIDRNMDPWRLSWLRVATEEVWTDAMVWATLNRQCRHTTYSIGGVALSTKSEVRSEMVPASVY